MSVCDEAKPNCDNCTQVLNSCIYERIVGEIPGRPVRIRRRRLKEVDPTSALPFINISSKEVDEQGIEILQGPYFKARLSLNGPSSTRLRPSAGKDVPARVASIATRAASSETQPSSTKQMVPMTGNSWQTAPSTCLSIGTRGEKMSLIDVELHCFYLQVTSNTVPYATLSVRPWKDLGFQKASKNPFYYHITLAVSAAHQRFLHSIAIQTANESNHIVKALASLRQVLEVKDIPGFPIASSADMCAVFATTVLLIVHAWCSPMDDL
ncbi:hypothetical protein TWF694_010402 [Orbilia ellipsospora]|uniref:Uncharacterized protein n=1 Tax=Orbilia ellipsospora TaxID=2528407 RepID=A0AAV9XCT9_9PEZI